MNIKKTQSLSQINRKHLKSAGLKYRKSENLEESLPYVLAKPIFVYPMRKEMKKTVEHPVKKIIRSNTQIIKQEFEDPPLSPVKSVNNERIFWKKRRLPNYPLLIIVFEGVAGCYSKNFLWSDEKPQFVLRENFAEGISLLRSHFYLVLVTTFDRQASKELVSLLESKQNLFDAIYMKRNRMWSPRHTHDISSILLEFNIKDISAVLAASSVGIDITEILTRTGRSLIKDSSSSCSKPYLTYHTPSFEKDSPVTVLLPHYLFMNRYQSFLDLSLYLIKLKKSGLNFFQTFEKISEIKLKTQLEDPSNKYSSSFLPSHRFVFFTQENFSSALPSGEKPKRLIF